VPCASHERVAERRVVGWIGMAGERRASRGPLVDASAAGGSGPGRV